MIDIVSGIAVAAVGLTWLLKRRKQPRLPMQVDNGPQLDLMAQVRKRNFENHLERARAARRAK